MKRSCLPLSLATLLVALLAVFALRGAAAQSGEIPPVVMVAQTSRGEYWLGEPVALRADIYNWSSPEITMTGSFGLQGMTDLRIVHDARVGQQYRAHLKQAPLSNKSIKLPYGKAFEFRIIAVYDPNNPSGLAFPQPGVYQFQLNQYLEYINRFTSNPAQTPYPLSLETSGFRVVPPPADAAGALSLLQSTRDGFRDLNRLMASPATREALEKVARDYPKSRYAPWCLHALGSFALNLLSFVPAEAERAEWAYRRILDNYSDYPLRDEVRLHLARVYERSQRMNLARESIERLLSDSEDNFFRFRESEILQPYRGSIDNPNAAINRLHWDLFPTTQLPDAYEQIRMEQLR